MEKEAGRRRRWGGVGGGGVTECTVVNDSVLQQSLSQVHPFFGVPRLPDVHQPGHKLTGDTQQGHG